jgi:hypothetical protein
LYIAGLQEWTISAMKLRLLIVSCLIAPLAGCVSFGSTDFLVTPVGVVAVHSFAPPATPVQDTDSPRSEPTLSADASH